MVVLAGHPRELVGVMHHTISRFRKPYWDGLPKMEPG